MINPSEIDLKSLPWLPLDAKAAFPKNPAIYFAIDSTGKVQYIGRSVNPRARWQNHHQYENLESIGNVRIAYLFVDSPDLLPQIEAALIEWFTPLLNVVGNKENHSEQSKTDGEVINTIKQLVDKKGISVYQFRKETGIAQATAYRLYNNPDEIPRKDVMEAICRTYKVQPGEILAWIEDVSTDENP
ncbi:MAG TPA: helix-turn-helix domain-containing protein [Nostocaceae cyanobacterium]|nr:helix-turn-helix domain-containing protein [Nostocaceae cyanobacterium]